MFHGVSCAIDSANAKLFYKSYGLPLFFFVLLCRKFDLYQLPHMLPSEEAFAAAVSALGIENKDDLVVYDGKGIFSAARVWW